MSDHDQQAKCHPQCVTLLIGKRGNIARFHHSDCKVTTSNPQPAAKGGGSVISKPSIEEMAAAGGAGDYTDSALSVALVNSNLSINDRLLALQAITGRAEARAERDALAAQIATLTAQRDALAKERDVMIKHAAHLTTEGVKLLNERDEAMAERDKNLETAAMYSCRADTFIAQRDMAIAGRDDLLAIIHRDGGQHTSKVGAARSAAEAHEVWAKVMRVVNAAVAIDRALDAAELAYDTTKAGKGVSLEVMAQMQRDSGVAERELRAALAALPPGPAGGENRI